MKRIDHLEKILEDHMKQDERLFKEFTDAIKKTHSELVTTNKKLDNILEIYNGFGFITQFLIKTGALAGAVTAIGAFFYAIIQITRQIR